MALVINSYSILFLYEIFNTQEMALISIFLSYFYLSPSYMLSLSLALQDLYTQEVISIFDLFYFLFAY